MTETPDTTRTRRPSSCSRRSGGPPAEQRRIQGLFDPDLESSFDPSHYLGATGPRIGRVIARAQSKERP